MDEVPSLGWEDPPCQSPSASQEANIWNWAGTEQRAEQRTEAPHLAGLHSMEAGWTRALSRVLKLPSRPLLIFRCHLSPPGVSAPHPTPPPAWVGHHPARRGRMLTGTAQRIGRIRNRFGARKQPPFPGNHLLPSSRLPHRSRHRKGADPPWVHGGGGFGITPREHRQELSGAGPRGLRATGALQKARRERVARCPSLASPGKPPQQRRAPPGRGNLAAEVLSSSPGRQTGAPPPLPLKKYISFC